MVSQFAVREREFHEYSARSITRDRGGPSWADLARAHIGPFHTEALGSEDGFFGRLATWKMGSLQFVLSKMRGASVRAVSAGLPQSPSAKPNLWLGVCLSGGYRIERGGRVTEVGPEGIAVLNYSVLETTTFNSSCDALWVRVPHEFLPAQTADEDAIVIDARRGAGYLAHNALRAIVDRAQESDLGDQPGLVVDGLMKLVTAAVLPHVQATSGPRSPRASAALRRVKQYVEENLGNTNLGLQTVADAVGLGARQVNKLFETEHSSLMRWTWARRLERARLALENGGTRSIGEVARAVGFKDLSHFSRAFHARFGCAPSRIKQGMAGSAAQ